MRSAKIGPEQGAPESELPDRCRRQHIVAAAESTVLEIAAIPEWDGDTVPITVDPERVRVTLPPFRPAQIVAFASLPRELLRDLFRSTLE